MTAFDDAKPGARRQQQQRCGEAGTTRQAIFHERDHTGGPVIAAAYFDGRGKSRQPRAQGGGDASEGAYQIGLLPRRSL
jgi:hypothetical protein